VSIDYTPKQYQLSAIEHLCANPGAGLFAKPGMGKTSATLAAFTVLRDAGAVKSMLVVAPLRPTYKVWPAEIQKWSDFNGLTFEILHGSKKAEASRRPADVYLINYEGLKWLETNGIPSAVDMLVLDESTKIKSHKAGRTQIATAISRQMKRCVILTGTPAPNSIMDLFAQIRALDGGVRLETGITKFRRKYCFEEPQRGGYSKWTVKPGAVKAIVEKVADICYTLDYEGHLEMPELITNVINVELPKSARSTYEELADKFYAAVAGGTVAAKNAAVVGMKLRQIVGGGVYTEEGSAEFETNKLEALRDLIEEQAGSPLIVAVGFKHEVERIRAYLAHLGDEAGPLPYLGGGVSTKASNEIIDEWNAGRIPVLLCHPTSVAHGLNLQAGGNSVCWYTLTWNLEEHIQLNGRVWRQGQPANVVTIHYIVAEDTIDERVVEVLTTKNANQNELIKSLRRA
jgi:SNF2 family DNA or RNA helicase